MRPKRLLVRAGYVCFILCLLLMVPSIPVYAQEGMDRSDAPLPYPATFHGLTDYTYLGALTDGEGSALHDPQAMGDDLDNLDDEDGVLFLTDCIPGQLSIVRVETYVKTGEPGRLQAWIDFNQDFDWDDEGEQIIVNFMPGIGHNTYDLQFDVPAVATLGPTFARFVISLTEDCAYDQETMDGEVEDYMLEIEEDLVPVGGDVYPINKMILFIPWIVLAAIVLCGGIYLAKNRVFSTK